MPLGPSVNDIRALQRDFERSQRAAGRVIRQQHRDLPEGDRQFATSSSHTERLLTLDATLDKWKALASIPSCATHVITHPDVEGPAFDGPDW
jgi:hypothetical protein